MSEVLAQVKALSRRLAEVNQLPLEGHMYILQGLTKCSFAEFTGTFELLLNQERVNQMYTLVTLGNTTNANLKKIKNPRFGQQLLPLPKYLQLPERPQWPSCCKGVQTSSLLHMRFSVADNFALITRLLAIGKQTRFSTIKPLRRMFELPCSMMATGDVSGIGGI